MSTEKIKILITLTRNQFDSLQEEADEKGVTVENLIPEIIDYWSNMKMPYAGKPFHCPYCGSEYTIHKPDEVNWPFDHLCLTCLEGFTLVFQVAKKHEDYY